MPVRFSPPCLTALSEALPAGADPAPILADHIQDHARNCWAGFCLPISSEKPARTMSLSRKAPWTAPSLAFFASHNNNVHLNAQENNSRIFPRIANYQSRSKYSDIVSFLSIFHKLLGLLPHLIQLLQRIVPFTGFNSGEESMRKIIVALRCSHPLAFCSPHLADTAAPPTKKKRARMTDAAWTTDFLVKSEPLSPTRAKEIPT